jgi:hypothetical protein
MDVLKEPASTEENMQLSSPDATANVPEAKLKKPVSSETFLPLPLLDPEQAASRKNDNSISALGMS